MMCSQHAAEITEKIAQERNLTEDHIKNAMKKASRLME